MSAFSVRRLTPEDLGAYQAIRLRCLREEPQAFGSSFEDEAAFPPEVWEKRLAPFSAAGEGDSAVFGGFLGPELVGLAGFAREARRKSRHIAMLVQVYLAPPARGRGFSRPLVESALAAAEAQPGIRALELYVIAENAPARALYESLGFVETGRCVESLQVEGRFYDEILMRRPVLPCPARP